MMDINVRKANKMLVPKDQLVIDAMIIALYEKDKQLRDVLKEVEKRL